MVFSRRFSEGFKFQLLSKGGHAEQNPRKKKMQSPSGPFCSLQELERTPEEPRNHDDARSNRN